MSGDVRSEVGAASSVGKALESKQVYSVTHPYYRSLAGAIEEKVAQLTAKRSMTKAQAPAVLVTVNLDSYESQQLSEYYPEFSLLNYGNGRPGHSWWVQFRRLANEWLMVQAAKYSTSVAHLGGSLVSYLFSEFEDAYLLSDSTCVSAVHERHSSTYDAYRLMMNYAKVSQEMSSKGARSKYEAYLKGEKFRQVTVSQGMPKAQVLCVDNSLYAYSPLQVAAMMMESGAEMAFGCFVYSSCMLLNEEGELPGTGVRFKKTRTGMVLSYPEGAAGVGRYPQGVWESWLSSQVFPVGVGVGRKWFQLELLQERNHLMFYRMTMMEHEPVETKVYHALEVPGAKDLYMVSSWELKSLGADPAVLSNWNHAPFVVSRRIVDRVYGFAMQLEKEQFTRFAVRKQIHVVNDRTTIEGTSVKVNSPLGIKMVNAMVVAVYSRAFVDRYESGRLTQEMMATVKQLAGFSRASFLKRMWIIARVCACTVWDYTFGYVNRFIRDSADWIREVIRGTVAQMEVDFSSVPPYILLSDVATKWLSRTSGMELLEVARAQVYRASVSTAGFSGIWASAFQRLSSVTVPTVSVDLFQFRVEQVMMHDPVVSSEAAEQFVRTARYLNPVVEEEDDRHVLEATQAVRLARTASRPSFQPDPDPVFTLNEFYRKVCPGVGLQNLEYDTASISLDPQDRTLAAPYLRLPTYFGDAPKPRSLYGSKLSALNVPKRQGTLQELLSSMAARNLNAPQVALPQDEDAMIQDIWANFLKECCLPDFDEKLARFQSQPVDLTSEGLKDWCAQATPDKVRMAKEEMEKNGASLAEMPVGEYLAMLKSDVKPTLSTKPIESRTEPQVIVYHEKALSAMYSSMFRMLVRRLLSLLKPNYHVNLLKDSRDMEDFVRGIHPFGASVQYLENDFSKYDKSQGRFVFKLEEFVFRKLGLNEDMLAKWVDGHVECSVRSVALGLSLHVMYQRKSGDATTSFGNVLLNLLSVSYAYRGTNVLWALFMGDDSLVCAQGVGCQETAVEVLAEVFNLGAKTYVTDAPYFASNFVLIDSVNSDVAFVPDPVKRIERWSMSIAADDPQWKERYVSAADSMSVYLNVFNTSGLSRAISKRYPVPLDEVGDVASAVATLVSDWRKFRGMWELEPTVSMY